MEEIAVNKYQTPITEELFEGLPDEIKEQFFDYVGTIPFIKSLISPNREYAKDRPRDDRGRIIVDLAHPHILEDMDYFREAAIHYKEYGCYTKLTPNKNPNSAYMKWLRRERDRCWDGMVRPSDGEWITGAMYFYINYCPIMVVKQAKDKNGKRLKKAPRVEGFPEIWEGVYWRFHYLEQAKEGGLYNQFEGGMHAAELARRGCGKSFSLAGLMAKNLNLGDTRESHTRGTTILTAYTKEYLADKDGTLSKFTPMLNHIRAKSPLHVNLLKNSAGEMTWQAGYKNKDGSVNINSSLNTVIGVSSKDDEKKLRGKRGWILFEEFGSFPKLLDIYNNVKYSVEQDGIAFATIYLVGTAGDDASDFAGAKELIYNSQGYDIYTLPNVWDKVGQSKQESCFFYPAYINRLGYYNKDGVTDVVMSILDVLKLRYKKKHETSDPSTILKVVAEMPMTPAEAIIKAGTNMFPVADLMNRLGQLEGSGELDEIYTGDLVFDNKGEITFTPTAAKPIRIYPIEGNKDEGCIEIIKHPEKDATGVVYSNRYIAGIDPYDDDSSNTQSLGSIFVLDLWTDKIVCEYTGRPKYADDFFEKCRRILLYYNAKANYENNKKGLFNYFRQHNCLYLLTEILEFLKDSDPVKAATTYGNKKYGTNATLPINQYGKDLLNQWLRMPVTIHTEDEQEIITPALYQIKNKAFLLELISHNPVGNFDRISAMGMLMLLRADILALYSGEVTKTETAENDPNYGGNDDFFTRNYDKKLKSSWKCT